MTGIDKSTISKMRKNWNKCLGRYEYFLEKKFGGTENIVELDAMWFGANKHAPAGNL